MMTDLVTLAKFCADTGKTVKSMQRKIEVE